MRRYYRILEIPYDSSFPIVKQAYRDLVRVWHPDRFCHDERLQKLATEKLMQINEAYRVLRSLSPQEVEQNSAVSQPFSPQAEPIDWSRKATPASPVQDRAPLRKPVGWHRYYGVIAIPITGILLLLLAEALLEKTYSTDPPLPATRLGTTPQLALPRKVPIAFRPPTARSQAAFRRCRSEPYPHIQTPSIGSSLLVQPRRRCWPSRAFQPNLTRESGSTASPSSFSRTTGSWDGPNHPQIHLQLLKGQNR